MYELSGNITELLNNLALEENKSPEELLEKLIYKEHEERHLLWDRKTRTFVETPCPRINCFLKNNS